MEKREISEKRCDVCATHDDYTWVCFNGDSPYCPEPTEPDQCCPAFRRRQGIEEEE